ncbi:RagB/SusD family nutrient uptake outer membrane protein [Penaeicola halotolerans]|uniref:RagB/SusD family nutrient uptake outer membrane protein n=1 Tax=Penaeicola halotolerans TaxID=2793196 RepID=UPI001CF803B8|nr:RagB/SusD family nutrient uptake outer membrane protein [Penaeicola halotolerans]
MKNRFNKVMGLLMGLLISVTACMDLDKDPFNEETSVEVYAEFENYKNVLAKLYGGLALSGQQGPAGNADISGIDEGESNYMRAFWKMQELPTDEAIIGWNDDGLPQMNGANFTDNNRFITAMYYRIFYQISLANEFIRELSDDRLSSRGITGAQAEEARLFRTEARFLRAMSYYHAIDLFGNVPFVTEADAVGAFFPRQASRAELFDYVESELLAIIPDLAAPRTNEYPRADQAAARMVLAKLYLNAEVYINQPRHTEAITQLNEVINAGYSLHPNYDELFFSDNDQGINEVIFAIAYDAENTRSFGGTTFIVNASTGGAFASQVGVSGGWQGLRARPEHVNAFSNGDGRAMFFTTGRTNDIETVSDFGTGFPVMKFKNLTKAGTQGPLIEGQFVGIDFPLFRLADAYLMYAEAVLRGGSGGSQAQALTYVNEIRRRAYGDNSGDINAGELSLQFILDERMRELSWEAHRRSDLIRFGLFTGGDYLWQWKGGVKDGQSVPATRNLYPLPAAELTANPTLEQNDGY